MVAGFGAGKTYAAVVRNIKNKLSYPKLNTAYYLPTYDLVKKIGFPRFCELLSDLGVDYALNKSDAVITVEGQGQIIFRTMDAPERIIGYEVADSDVDELDTLPTDKARDCWNKIIARNRQKKFYTDENGQIHSEINTIGVATTPEGFKFVYDRWHKNSKPSYELIRASTYSNADNLPEGYIESLEEIYPTNLLSAYLHGDFVNLTAGSVYPDFDRKENASPLGVGIMPKETLHIGMDFNVGKMAAAIHVLRDDVPHAVAELTGILDTPAMISVLKSRYPDHKIIVYPDATGKNRKSQGASDSDIVLLQQAGFSVFVNPGNPAVKDRVLSFNIKILTKEKRTYFVNVDNCPHLVEALEKQAYDKNGEPDKSAGLDHIVDAAGYFVCYRYPIKRVGFQTVKVVGT